MTFQIVFILFFALGLVYLVGNNGPKVPKGLRLPPGPRGLPLIGSALELGKYPRHQFQKWADQYGEVVSVRIGFHRFILLNSPQAVKEILDKQAAVTSGRPPQPVLHYQVNGGLNLVSMDYGPQWRKFRSALHKCLSQKTAERLRASQEFEAKQTIFDILTNNANDELFSEHFKRYTMSVVMTAAYGQRVKSHESEDYKGVFKIMTDFNYAAQPMGFLANELPILFKLPERLQWWRKRALAIFDRQAKLWTHHWNALRKKYEEGTAPECFAKSFLEQNLKDSDGLTEMEGIFLGAIVVQAGSETTASTITTATKFLAANPEVQAKAYAELSSVVGEGRLPTYEDEQSLPYIRAIGKEVLRVRPVVTAVVPHYTHQDLVYKDYFIPRESVLGVCSYVLHNDESRFEAPEEFRPERYLSYPEKSAVYAAHPDPLARDHFSFGHGRRICSGIHLAENSIFILLACLIWGYEIKPALNANGVPLPVDTSDEAFEPYMFNLQPKPFKLRFVPRSEKHAEIIKQAWQFGLEHGYSIGDKQVNADGVVV